MAGNADGVRADMVRATLHRQPCTILPGVPGEMKALRLRPGSTPGLRSARLAGNGGPPLRLLAGRFVRPGEPDGQDAAFIAIADFIDLEGVEFSPQLLLAEDVVGQALLHSGPGKKSAWLDLGIFFAGVGPAGDGDEGNAPGGEDAPDLGNGQADFGEQGVVDDLGGEQAVEAAGGEGERPAHIGADQGGWKILGLQPGGGEAQAGGGDVEAGGLEALPGEGDGMPAVAAAEVQDAAAGVPVEAAGGSQEGGQELAEEAALLPVDDFPGVGGRFHFSHAKYGQRAARISPAAGRWKGN